MSSKITSILGILGAIGTIAAVPSVSLAASFTFSFDGVKGTVSGLELDGAGQMATSVIIEDESLGLTPPPLETIGDVVANSWTVSNGEITSATYMAQDLGVYSLTLSTSAGVLINMDPNNIGSTSGPITYSQVPEPATAFGLLAVAALGAASKTRKHRWKSEKSKTPIH